MWNQTSGMPWNELNQTVTRQRLTPESVTEDARGNPIPNWNLAPSQTVQCLIQPHYGELFNRSEGLTQKASHILFCNAQIRQSDSTPTDFAFGDRVTSQRGNRYKVVFVEDAGGQGDHLEVLIEAIEPGGD